MDTGPAAVRAAHRHAQPPGVAGAGARHGRVPLLAAMKIAFVILFVAAGAAGAFWFGAYDISATDPHLAPTYWTLDAGMRRSVKRRAADIAVPKLDEPSKIQKGL